MIRQGTAGVAEAVVKANAEPSTLRVQCLNAHLSVLSPSDGVAITKPAAASLVVSEGQGNGLVINAAADKAYVVDTIGQVTQLSADTYDLRPEDGQNVVLIKL